MRFVATLCSFALFALVQAGDGDAVAPATTSATGKAGKAGKNGKAGKAGKNAAAASTLSASAAVSDRSLAVGSTFGVGRSCPYNNCNSCTNQVGCYWTSAGCSNIPCSVYGFCAIAPAQCGGCQRDSQCGSAPRRCENGQCVGVEGDKACDFYRDCAGCLSRPNCLWDPNTVTGSCKPKEQCDFTYEQRSLSLSAAPALPPATACVRTLDRCSQTNFNGVGLDLNPNRGVGCTNHGQCRPDQYCYSCSKCTGNCASCRAPGVPVAGICGPAWRCPIDNDSITQTCPVVGNPVVVPPPVNTCSNYRACGSCTAAYGCVWSGTSCYYSTVACNNYGCANTPQQCTSVHSLTPRPPNCAFHNCQNCAASPGCVWSGQYCYFAYSPCTNYGCANTPAQCGGCTSSTQCGFGFRCDNGVCLQSAGDRSCDYYNDCTGCLSNANCLWDPNTLYSNCKPKEQCDFTYRALAIGAVATPPATACVRTVDKCFQNNFNGAPLDPNQDRGYGCTNHGQCLNGQYCFSCSKCRGNCSPCYQSNGAPISGACAPIAQCRIDQDSINDLCPIG